MAPLAHTLTLLAMTLTTAAIKVVPLDLAQGSFDDQYWGCRLAMTAALPALNRSEFQKNPDFAWVWKNATAEWQNRGSRVSPLSSPAQAIAVMAYSMKYVDEEFNIAVRRAGRSPQEYRDNFHFKVLHFLLTDALATLRDSWGQQCHHVFQGVHDVLFQAGRGDTVRFGQFMSTSLSEEVAQKYGTDTVFRVFTCYGVDIQNFSYDPGNHEVVIPPFEAFHVTEVTQEGDKAQIHLRSAGTFNKYNCEWLKGGSVPQAHFHLGGLLLATTALAVATGIL